MVASRRIDKHGAPFDEHPTLIGNTGFTNVGDMSDQALMAVHALDGAIQCISQIAPLKNIGNLPAHHPVSSPQGSCMDESSIAAAVRRAVADETSDGGYVNPDIAALALDVVIQREVLNRPVHQQGFSAKELAVLAGVNHASHDRLANPLKSKKAAWLAQSTGSLEEFGRQLDSVSVFPPRYRKEPLEALGLCILRLQEEDQLPAITRFREAVQALPELHRNGLFGMYEAAKKNDRKAFAKWPLDTFDLVKSKIFQTDALYSHSLRQAIAAKYCLTEVGFPRLLEWKAFFLAAQALLIAGSSTQVALQKHDLDHAEFWGNDWHVFRHVVDASAFNLGPAEQEVKDGADYLAVAQKYGIEHPDVLEEMKGCYENARSSSEG